MSVTKALGTLTLVSGRGLDNGEAGALILANQVAGGTLSILQTCNKVLEVERNREAHVKLAEKQKRPGKRAYRSQEAIEQERSLAKWTSTKVGEGHVTQAVQGGALPDPGGLPVLQAEVLFAIRCC